MCFYVSLSFDIILLKLFFLFLDPTSRISSKPITYTIRLRSNIAYKTISLFICKISDANLTFDISAVN